MSNESDSGGSTPPAQGAGRFTCLSCGAEADARLHYCTACGARLHPHRERLALLAVAAAGAAVVVAAAVILVAGIAGAGEDDAASGKETPLLVLEGEGSPAPSTPPGPLAGAVPLPAGASLLSDNWGATCQTEPGPGGLLETREYKVSRMSAKDVLDFYLAAVPIEDLFEAQGRVIGVGWQEGDVVFNVAVTREDASGVSFAITHACYAE